MRIVLYTARYTFYLLTCLLTYLLSHSWLSGKMKLCYDVTEAAWLLECLLSLVGSNAWWWNSQIIISRSVLYILAGVISICMPLAKLGYGLKKLKLSRTGLTAAGVCRVAETLLNNTNMLSTLKHLDLSHNALRGEDITVLSCLPIRYIVMHSRIW